MKKFILFFVIVSHQCMAFCQANPLIKYLPDSAKLIVHINPIRLISKMPLETLTGSPMFKELLKDPKMPLGSMLSNPLGTGIDFLPGVFIAMNADAENSKPGSNTSVFIKLSDAALFTAKMKELFKGEFDSVIKKYGTDRILETGKGMMIGWNNDLLVMTSAIDKNIAVDMELPVADTMEEKDYAIQMDQLHQKKLKDQRNLCFDLLTPKPQNFFSGDNRFANFMNLESDIKTWNDGMPMLAGNKIMGMFFGSGSKMPSLAGSKKTSIVNFENGRIVIQGNNYLPDEILAVYKNYPTASLNMDLVKKLPKGKILGMVNTSFNAQLGKDMIEKLGLKEKLKELKTPMPFDMDLVTGAFGNNMLLAVLQADENEVTDSLTSAMKNIKLVLAMPIVNKAKFDALKKTVLQSIDSIQKDKGESKMMKGMNPTVKNNESMVVLSLSPEVANAFLKNAGTQNVPEWLQAKSQYPMVMNMNLKEIMKMLMGKNISDKKDAGDQKLLDMFDQLVMYGGNFENGSIATNFEFRFTNQTENSLKQLINLLSAVADKKIGNVAEEKE